MKPIQDICDQATSSLYNSLAAGTRVRSPRKLREAITAAHAAFIPYILPEALRQALPEVLNEPDAATRGRTVVLYIEQEQREVLVHGVRRAWTSADEASLTELSDEPEHWTGRLIAAEGGFTPVPTTRKRPGRISGLSVVEISLEWRVLGGEPFQQYTFVLDDSLEVSAVSIRLPSRLRVPLVGVSRIAHLTIALVRAFYGWIIETLTDVVREQTVRLSSQLYRRPRVLLPDISATLAFACLMRGRDFVLFDDASLQGFLQVMAKAGDSSSLSPLQLSGLLLGEIVEHHQSAISFVEDKKDGDSITIDLRKTKAYSNDEALRHAITTAWGTTFVCTRLLTYRNATFVLFCPALSNTRVSAYVVENLSSIQTEIKRSFDAINDYVSLIEDLRLGSIFDEPPMQKRDVGFIQKARHSIVTAWSSRTVRQETLQTALTMMRKAITGGL